MISPAIRLTQIEETRLTVVMITLHVIDVSRAVPAAGMRVELYRLDSERVPLTSGVLDEKGVFETAGETPVPPGVYEAVFHVGAYYRNTGVELSDPAFLECAEGLVEEKDLGLDREAAGKRDALLLAARKLAGNAVGEVAHLHQGEAALDDRR